MRNSTFIVPLSLTRLIRRTSTNYKRVHKLAIRKIGEDYNGNVHVFTPLTSNPAGLRVNEQALYLTKSVVTTTPDVYDGLEPTVTEEMVEQCRLSLIHTRSFFADDQELDNVRGREKSKDKSSGVKPLMNAHRIVGMNAHKWYADYHKHCLCFGVGISTNWRRSKVEHPLQVSSREGHIMYRKQLLSPFWNTSHVNASEDQEINWEFLTSPTFHIAPSPGINLRLDTGFQSGIPYPCPTTLIMSEHNGKYIHNAIQKGIMFSFGIARSYALSHGLVDENGDLQTPVPIQCIMIGSRLLKLICFQLNTVNMEPNDGVKNLVWFKDTQLFYRGELNVKLQKRSLTSNLQDFDPESIKLLFKFFVNGSQRLE